MKKVWLEFIRYTSEYPIFPRDLAFFERVKVNNLKTYLTLIKVNIGKRNCATSIYSDFQREKELYDLIFLDFDSDNGINDDMFNLVKKIALTYSGVLVFSGKKGFHLYLALPLLHFNSDLLKIWAREYLLKKFPEAKEYFDFHVVGDKSRIARLPYTLHLATNLYAFIIPSTLYSSTMETILNMAKNPPLNAFNLTINNNLVFEVLNVIKKYKKVVKTPRENFRKIEALLPPLPLCLQVALNKLVVEGEMSHIGRLNLASFLLSFGVPYEKIFLLFKKYANDFNEEKTNYQINYLRERAWRCHSCDNLKLMGFCPLDLNEVCIYYPQMDKVGVKLWITK
jgi:hypothetical protein